MKRLGILFLVLFLGCSPPAPLTKEADRTPVASQARATPQPPIPDSTPLPTPSRAVSVPRVAPSDIAPEVERLGRELTVGKSSDQEKAKALYEWIGKNVRYDVEAYFSNTFPDDDPEVVLATRTAICGGYAKLFLALATSVGLEAEIVPGLSKGFGFETAAKDRKSDHAWNAVKIDGEWRLLDATWGSGHINDENRFVADYGTEWFLVKPEEFIFTHLPEDQRWQLLSAPLDRTAFLAQANVSPPYFEYGLSLKPYSGSSIQAGSRLEMEVTSQKKCRMMAKVQKGKTDLDASYALVERRGDRFFIEARFPEPGDYRLILFCGPPDELKTESAVTYAVTATAGEKSPFPKTLGTFLDEQVRLISPRHSLRRGETAQLQLEAPGATKLVAVMGDEHVPLEKSGDRFHLNLVPKGDKMTIFGSYDDTVNYGGLVEYEVRN